MITFDFRYALDQLQSGYYAFRVQAVSLGKKGRYSSYIFVNVKPRTSLVVIVIGSIASSIVLCITAMGIYYVIKKSNKSNTIETFALLERNK